MLGDAEWAVAACWARYFCDSWNAFDTWDNDKCKIRNARGKALCRYAAECRRAMNIWGEWLPERAYRVIWGETDGSGDD